MTEDEALTYDYRDKLILIKALTILRDKLQDDYLSWEVQELLSDDVERIERMLVDVTDDPS